VVWPVSVVDPRTNNAQQAPPAPSSALTGVEHNLPSAVAADSVLRPDQTTQSAGLMEFQQKNVSRGEQDQQAPAANNHSRPRPVHTPSRPPNQDPGPHTCIPGATHLALLLILLSLLLCLPASRGPPIPEPVRGRPGRRLRLGSCWLRSPGVWLCCHRHAEPNIHSSAHDRTQQHRWRHRLPQVRQPANAAETDRA
jgi:hypothetical protein